MIIEPFQGRETAEVFERVVPLWLLRLRALWRALGMCVRCILGV